MKKMQNGGNTRPVQNASKVTISPSSSSSKTPVKKAPVKKANPPRGTMDLIRGSKKSDYIGTVTQAAKKGGSVKKYQDGGKVTRADIRDAQRAAKLKRIEAGTEPSTYEKVANISGNVAKTAVAAGETAKAVRDTRTGMSGPGGMQKGGATKKYQNGGRTISSKAAERKTAKGKGFTSSVMGPNPSGDKGKYVPFTRQGRKDAKETGMVSSNEMKPSRKIMKKGGMTMKKVGSKKSY